MIRAPVPDVGVPERVAHLYFTQLMAGVDFIHSKGVCHRDLKPENVMLGINGFLKVCDFGLCAVYKHKGMERLLMERCGSLPYVAPEVCHRRHLPARVPEANPDPHHSSLMARSHIQRNRSTSGVAA